MQKVFFLASTILAISILNGCTVAPKREVYDNISKQMDGAAGAAAAAPVASDDAVSNALLPPVAALVEQLPQAKPVLEERFTINYKTPVPAQQFFAALGEQTRYTVLVDPKIDGAIMANLKDVTLFEALDAVRDLYGYDYSVNGARIMIKPLTMQTRMFQVNYLVGNRRGGSNLRVTSTSISGSSGSSGGSSSSGSTSSTGSTSSSGGAGVQGDSSTVSTTVANDFWGDLRSSLESIVGSKDEGRKVVVSAQSGVIVIRAMPDEIRNVNLYLRATQLSIERQVILEAKILEVELNDSFQSGVNWSAFGTSGANRLSSGYLAPGTTATASSGGLVANSGTLAAGSVALANPAAGAGSLFGLALQTSNFSVLISFLESQGTVHVLSSPRIATLNNQKALLKIGTDEFFVTGVTTTSTTSATGNTVTPSVTVAPFFSGVVLDVTPQIDGQGNIILHVHPSVSQVTTVVKGINLGSAGSVSLPLAASASSEMDSIVRGQDGRVVAIGGLMRQSSSSDNSQLPGVGDVPVLGALFRNRAQNNQKRELVVLIKPTIVESASTWETDLLDVSNRIKQLAPDRAESK